MTKINDQEFSRYIFKKIYNRNWTITNGYNPYLLEKYLREKNINCKLHLSPMGQLTHNIIEFDTIEDETHFILLKS